jgi:7-cyano-7-deazaguanine synthase
MKKKAFVLLSGGLDSTTCLAKALFDYEGSVEAVSIDYGQRHLKETECAKKICDHYHIKHSIIDLKGIMSGPQVMLTDKSVEVPNISYDEIKGVSPTYVPFRNGTMLSALTAHAQKYVMSQIAGAGEDSTEVYTALAKDLCGIYFGAHAEDAHNWAYPDCTPEFVGAMANAIYIGTYFTVRLHAPFINSTKAEIVKVGKKLHVPYELTWSCYKGEDTHCGTCPTCRARKEAFDKAGAFDPTEYANYS